MSFLNFNDEDPQLQIYNPLFTEIQKNIFKCIESGGTESVVKPKIFCIDGNIGSGKSTILDELKRRGYVVFKEKLEEWLPILGLFYEDPKRWMLTLQIKISTSMGKQYEEMCTDEVGSAFGATTFVGGEVSRPFVFVERSPLSTLLFIKNGIRNGYLTFEEIKLFSEVFNQNFWAPDNIFYVQTPVDVCFNRKCRRDRKCEKSIETKYLQQLDKEYNNMYMLGSESAGTKYFTSVQTIDGTEDVKTITNTILEKCKW